MREKRAEQEGRRGKRGGGGAEAGAGGGGTEPDNISCIYICTITWLHDYLLYFLKKYLNAPRIPPAWVYIFLWCRVSVCLMHSGPIAKLNSIIISIM